VHDTYNPYYIH